MNAKDGRPLFLFEPEAGTGWAGPSHLPRDLSLGSAAWISAAVLLAVLAFLAFGRYTRLVRAEGVLLPACGLTRLTAPAEGWISSSRVSEGDAVRQGDVLYALRLDHTTGIGWAGEARLGLLHVERQEVAEAIERQAVLLSGEKRQQRDEMANLRSERDHLDSRLAMLSKFSGRLERNWLRQEELVARGISTLGQAESREQAHMSYQLQAGEAARERLRLDGRIAQLEHQLVLHDQKAEIRLGELRQRLVEIDRQILEGEVRREIRVVAPRDGIVTSVVAREGQAVRAGAPLLTIVPHQARLLGELLVAGSAIGFVQPRDEVLLRYEAFPHAKYGQFRGRIISIARSELRRDELEELTSTGLRGPAGSYYRATVELDEAEGSGFRLQPGMHFEAYIRTETRQLYEWMLFPLSRVADRLAEL